MAYGQRRLICSPWSKNMRACFNGQPSLCLARVFIGDLFTFFMVTEKCDRKALGASSFTYRTHARPGKFRRKRFFHVHDIIFIDFVCLYSMQITQNICLVSGFLDSETRLAYFDCRSDGLHI